MLPEPIYIFPKPSVYSIHKTRGLSKPNSICPLSAIRNTSVSKRSTCPSQKPKDLNQSASAANPATAPTKPMATSVLTAALAVAVDEEVALAVPSAEATSLEAAATSAALGLSSTAAQICGASDVASAAASVLLPSLESQGEGIPVGEGTYCSRPATSTTTTRCKAPGWRPGCWS